MIKLISHERQGAQLLAPQGRIDQITAEEFRLQLAPHLENCTEGAQPVIIDFSAVPYISSVGLRVLMLAARQVSAQKGWLAIAALTPLVREVFSISRFDLILKTFGTVDEAVAAFAGQHP